MTKTPENKLQAAYRAVEKTRKRPYLSSTRPELTEEQRSVNKYHIDKMRFSPLSMAAAVKTLFSLPSMTDDYDYSNSYFSKIRINAYDEAVIANCGEQCDLTALNLLKYEEIEQVLKCRLSKIDHSFLVIPDTFENIDGKVSCGPNSIFVDPWDNKILLKSDSVLSQLIPYPDVQFDEKIHQLKIDKILSAHYFYDETYTLFKNNLGIIKDLSGLWLNDYPELEKIHQQITAELNSDVHRKKIDSSKNNIDLAKKLNIIFFEYLKKTLANIPVAHQEQFYKEMARLWIERQNKPFNRGAILTLVFAINSDITELALKNKNFNNAFYNQMLEENNTSYSINFYYLRNQPNAQLIRIVELFDEIIIRKIEAHFLAEENINLLFYAIEKKDVTLLKLLLSKKCDLNVKNKSGISPLHWACQQDNLEIVELLLQHGASVHATDILGATPLHHAAENPDGAKLIPTLIRFNADLHAPCADPSYGAQMTPLHLAAKGSLLTNVEILTKLGANPILRSDWGDTPADLSTDQETKQFLLDCEWIFLEPLEESNFSEMEQEIEISSDFNILSSLKENFYQQILKNTNYETFKDQFNNYEQHLLAFHKALNDMVHSVTPDKPSLIKSTQQFMHELIEEIDKKYYLSCCHKLDKTTYINFELSASLGDKLKSALMLLNHEQSRLHFIINLLNNLAACEPKLLMNKTIAEIVAQLDTTLARIVYEIGPSPKKVDFSTNNALIKAILANNFNLSRLLIIKGFDINSQTENNFSPLIYAVQSGQKKIVKLLLKHGADPSTMTNEGLNALHYAAKNPNGAKIIELLIKHIHIEQKRGRTPTGDKLTALHLAAAANNIACVKKLLELGADPFQQTTTGQRASSLTTNPAIKEILLQSEQMKELEQEFRTAPSAYRF